jgi:hypothetical protein
MYRFAFRVFDSVMMIAFQSFFRLKIHKKYIFYFSKIIFYINILERYKNTKKNNNLNK